MIPVLIYLRTQRRCEADWLSKAFGFTVRLRIANHRIQMKAGEGCFTIAEGSVSPNNSHIVQVRIEDAKEVTAERARQRMVPSSLTRNPKTNPMASANTTLRTFTATAGTSPKPSPMSLPKNGAVVHFILS